MLMTKCLKMKQLAYRTPVRLAVLVLLLAATSPATAQNASFQGLSDLPGGSFISRARGVSADGSVVVGTGRSASGNEAFRWTSGGGMVGLGDLPGGYFRSHAYGASADGSVVVGLSNSAVGEEAIRWTTGSGMVGLGGAELQSSAFSVSADGSVFVGGGQSTSGLEASRWTEEGGMLGLGDLPGGDFYSNAKGVSADGTVVVGLGRSESGVEAFRWTAAGGMVGLGDLPGGYFVSYANGVSADGSVVVGRAWSTSGQEAFRWENDVMVGLGDLPGHLFRSEALAVSADGSVVVGWSRATSGNEAFIWDATNGMRSLKPVLEDDFGLDLTGWRLDQAWGISDDGLVIVGWGFNPSGNREAWRTELGPPNHGPVVTCPEPIVAQCSETGGATVELVADVFDEDGHPLEITWHITAPDGAVTTVNDVVMFADPPVPVEVTLFRLFPLGLSEVSLTVDDGTVSTNCPSPVSVCVEDTEAPIIATLETLVEVGTDAGECFATLNFDPATSPFAPLFSDTCSLNATAANKAPATFPVGETVVTWTLSDGNGNSVNVAQTVVVTDDEAPDLVAPAGFAVVHDPGDCVATGVSLGTALTTDNCEVVDVFNDAPDFFGLGDTEVTWSAVDAAGNMMEDTQVVTVTNSAPVADAGADIIVECDSTAGKVVTLDGTGSDDADDPLASLSFTWSAVGISFNDDTSLTPSATFPKGSTTVSLLVTDPCGAMDSLDVIIVVEDTTAPQLQAGVVDCQVLWPPNHDMIPIVLDLFVRDTCENPEDLQLSCTVSSNEPDDEFGDGAFTGDVDGQDGYTNPVLVGLSYDATSGHWVGNLLLRAERAGGADGRQYSIVCRATDGTGNFSEATVCVTVPHSQKGGKK